MRRVGVHLLSALVGLAIAAVSAAPPRLAEAQSMPESMGAKNCGLAQVAFCDSFDEPHTGGGRTGQLDPSRWSIARLSSLVNPSQGYLSTFPLANAMHCRTPVSGVVPPNDYFVCGTEFGESNHFMEALNDGGNYVFNDARIRQPFDFTGRTGTITFDVDAKTAGGHGWWTEFWLTDQPVSAPHKNQVFEEPRNGIDLEFSDECGGPIADGTDGSPKGTLRVVRTFHNYVDSEAVAWQAGADGLALHHVDCYAAMPDMQNHFEIRVSQTHLEVWATDPMGSRLKQIATIDGINLPFSQGYVHLQHAAYNASKATSTERVSHSQTYHWDNVGFDGPVLPVPAQYSIPDSLTSGPNGGLNVGYLATEAGLQPGPRTFTDVNLSGAENAALTFTADVGHPHIKYRLNDGPWHQWEVRTAGMWNTEFVPVDLGELHDGSNTVDFAAVSDGATYPDQDVISNIDLLLPGARVGSPLMAPMPEHDTPPAMDGAGGVPMSPSDMPLDHQH